MSKRREDKSNALDSISEYAASKLDENEDLLKIGHATLTGWAGPRRCFVSLTNKRILIIWLRKKSNDIETMQEIPFDRINSFAYKLGLALYAPYNQKPFKPRLYLEISEKKKVLPFVFDDQQIAKDILKELDERIPVFHTS